MKLLFLTNVPSPYRVDFFNELGKQCDLTVLFEKDTSDERDVSWKQHEFRNFTGIVLKGKSISTDTAFCPSVIRYILDKTFDKIICSSFTYPTGMFAIQVMKLFRIPYYLECDGGFAKDGKGLKERIKKHFISGAEGYFSTGKTADEYYVTYGAKHERLIRYPFSSISEKEILEVAIDTLEKDKLRKKLGINEEKIVLTVGQFIHRKGFDVLLNAMRRLPSTVGVYFVGGKPTEEYLKLQKEYDLENAHFVGFKSKAELSEYYRAADIFVLPTREDIWGLVIEEAMAYGLPVVSTDKCAAALELIRPEENGDIVPVGDVELLAEAIRKIVFSNELCEKYGSGSLDVIGEYTIEKMSNCHLENLTGTKKGIK